ncbi:MAG: Gfo/Idh/MocA family oxidoreductase [Deltaproteobacteria bacterium]|nr:Gfo/Idh/MocA family oxidoreductase [Deltaproteobacteria bacterium]MBW2153669.1 Gfo/Idh/MocA family oxidoreductase [Deltaproteobacteria bacterium]
MVEMLKWGVLGNATIARVCIIPAIQKSKNGRVHALATRFPAGAEEVAEKNSIHAVYEGYDAVLNDPQIGAVYIPLPNHLHRPWTLKALCAGKHVLCEKPLACTAREAQEMFDTASKTGMLLMEAFMYRFHPRSLRIKQMIAERFIGEPRLLRSAFCYRFPENEYKSGQNARLKPQTGGGALLDVGCYSVSVARWLLGQEPKQVQAQAVYHPRGVDVHIVGLMRFSDSCIATLEASFISALQQTYTVVGSKGAIELPHDAFIPWQKDARFTVRGVDKETGDEFVVPGADEYQLMLEHFADAALGKRKLAFSAQDSILNMQVLDALAEAAKTGKTVFL